MKAEKTLAISQEVTISGKTYLRNYVLTVPGGFPLTEQELIAGFFFNGIPGGVLVTNDRPWFLGNLNFGSHCAVLREREVIEVA